MHYAPLLLCAFAHSLPFARTTVDNLCLVVLKPSTTHATSSEKPCLTLKLDLLWKHPVGCTFMEDFISLVFWGSECSFKNFFGFLPHFFIKKFFFIFKWRIIALQYCVGFCHTSKWISHRYTYVCSLSLPSTSHPYHSSRLSQSLILSVLQRMASDSLVIYKSVLGNNVELG